MKYFWLYLYCLKSRDYVFKMYVFKKLSIVLYSVHWYIHVPIKRLSHRATVVANRLVTASMLGVSDRWICSIIRHSRDFCSIEALGAV